MILPYYPEQILANMNNFNLLREISDIVSLTRSYYDAVNEKRFQDALRIKDQIALSLDKTSKEVKENIIDGRLP